MMQSALRAGVCLFMLSGSCVLSAQTGDGQTSDVKTTAAAKKTSPYVMKEISGHIYDAATKAPLAGAKVQALNNRLYTALTDDDGSYTIKVPDFVTSLYVSLPQYGAGMIAIKGDSDQNTSLYAASLKSIYADGTQLYAHQKMDVETSSALTVDNDIENKLNSTVRTINRGGIPAQGVAMFINGLNSLNANAQPLVVVDGVIWDMQYDRSTLHTGIVNNLLSIIDTEDIESVEVLKNGTAFYGAQGANGVILITTKRGKSMVTRINIRAYGGFETTPSSVKMMDASQYRNYVTDFLGTTSRGQEYFKSSTTVPSFMNEDPNYLLYPIYHNNTNWQDGMYETAFTQNYRVNVEGGDDVAMYNLSLGYSQADATAKQTDFNRLNIRFNSDIVMFNNFTTGLDISYARSAYNLRDNGWAEDYSSSNISSPNVLSLIQSPFISPYAHYIYYEDGGLHLGQTDKIYSGRDYTASNNPYRFASSFGYSGYVNPYWILSNGDGNNKNNMEQTQFSINVSPKYTFNKYLNLSDRFSYVMNRNNEKYYLPNDGTPATTVEGLGSVQSVLKSQFSKETFLFNDLRLNWKRQFGGHLVDLNAGFRLSSFSYNSSYITGYNNDQDKMPNMSMSLQYKDYGGEGDKWTNLAYYLTVGYNYKNKYFVDLGTTMEASSRFGKDASEGLKLFGVAWGLFPSVQLGWLMSSEKWFDVKGIDYFKLVAGYEESGNDNVDYWSARTYFTNGVFLKNATGLTLANIENPTIQWETTRRFNVGLQTSLLNNRLSVSADYYYAKTDNLLTRKAVSDITGLKYMWANDGALRNSGVDVNANAILVNTRDWKWQAGFSVGSYTNKITKLPESSLNYITTYALDENGQKTTVVNTIHGYTSSIYGSQNILTAVGSAAGVFYGYKTAGVFSSDEEASTAGKYGYLRYPTGLSQTPYRNFKAGDVHFVDQNGDGWISEADMVQIGDPNPDIYGNIYTSVSWKNLTLGLDFKYSLGNDIYNYQRSQLESANGIYNQTTAVVNRWKYNGQVTDIPRTMASDNDEWVNNERFSDRWIEDGSYLKLKKVRLTYKFKIPQSITWLEGLSVWGEANNVFTVTKYLGQDPEVSAGNSVLYQGIDAGYLPQNRNFNLGVTINL
jgi:TonB-linked SusC/RagA family outer membrane protein